MEEGREGGRSPPLVRRPGGWAEWATLLPRSLGWAGDASGRGSNQSPLRSPSRSPSRHHFSLAHEAIPEDAVLINADAPNIMYCSLDAAKVDASAEQAATGKAPFQDKLVLFMLLVLGMPAISCAWISRNPSVIYWLGQSGVIIPGGTMLWVFLGHNLLLRKALKRRLAVVIVFVIPIFSMMITAHWHKVSALSVRTRLETKDCASFPEKLNLEEAWQAAHELLDECLLEKEEATRAPLDELKRVTSVQQCPKYFYGMEKWAKEWKYLEALESTQRCAGWCDLHSPLWHNFVAYKPHDRCSLAVAEIMGGEVYRTARQVFAYCFCSLIFLGIFLSSIAL